MTSDAKSLKQQDSELCKFPHEYMTPEEAEFFLLSQRHVEISIDWCDAWKSMDFNVFVKHKGRRLRVGRVDMCHQVPTLIGSVSDVSFYQDPLKWFATKAHLGARIVDDAFYVIDSLTDG